MTASLLHIVRGTEQCMCTDEMLHVLAVNCTSHTTEVYGKIVDEIVAGNDSGAPQLCR